MRYQAYLEQCNADSLTMIDAEVPRPGPGQVLVKMRAASLNYRDLFILQGLYPGVDSKDLVPLSDGAGEVVETGAGVDRFAAGDHVIGTFFETWIAGRLQPQYFGKALGGTAPGVLTEYRLFPQDSLVAKPAHLSFEEAATLPCAALTAWNALFEGPAPLRAGDRVLVLGTGGVSMFALQFAKAAGAEVIATSSSDAKLEKAKALGATTLINYRSHPDWDQEVRTATGGVGVDHVVEVGGPGTLQRSIASLGQNGQAHLIGVLTGGEINPLPLLFTTSTVRGVFVGSREMFESMNRVISLHKIRPVIDRVFGFEEARAALAHQQSQAHVGKVVVSIG